MIHLSPLWGLEELVCRCAIHLSPLWGFIHDTNGNLGYYANLLHSEKGGVSDEIYDDITYAFGAVLAEHLRQYSGIQR